LIAWLIVLLLGGWLQAIGQTFQHPGILASKAQLDYMKSMVRARQEPFYSAFVKARNSRLGSLKYEPHGPPADGYIKCGPFSDPNIGCKDSDDDGTAAYLQALLWYITGNRQYASNAIAILNRYGYRLKGYSTQRPYSNAPLQAAWDSQKWPRAAEIIRYSHAGWRKADIQQFRSMLNTVILPMIRAGSTQNGNWEISMIEGLIGIGVFNDDVASFHTGINYWRQRIPAYFYFHADGPQPVAPPRGTANWYRQLVFNSSVDGISQETCRDFGHAQYGLAGALDAAETARIQGTDLYEEAKDRLTAALEFNAYYLLDNPVPASVCGGKVNLKIYPTDEIGYTEYHIRLGMNLPNTLEYLQKLIRKLPDPTERHIMVYESLTHGGDVSSFTRIPIVPTKSSGRF
jgi:Alginate lyase